MEDEVVDEGPEWGTGEWSVVLYCDGNPVIEEDNLNLAHPRDGGIAGEIAERTAAPEGKLTANPRGRTADHQRRRDWDLADQIRRPSVEDLTLRKGLYRVDPIGRPAVEDLD